MRFYFIFLSLFLFTLSAHSQRYHKVVSSGLNMRPEKNGKVDGKKVICTLRKGDEVRATDVLFDYKGRPRCKVEVLAIDGTESLKTPKGKKCNVGDMAYVAVWLMEPSIKTAHKFEPRLIQNDELYCHNLNRPAKWDLKEELIEMHNNSIQLQFPVKMRLCNSDIYGEKDCNCRGVSSVFGWREHPSPELEGKKMHRGVDLAVPHVTPVYAAADGWVSAKDFEETGYGKWIRIDHFDKSKEAKKQLRYNKDKKVTGVAPGQLVKLKVCGIEKEYKVDKLQTKYTHLDSYAKGIRHSVLIKKGQLLGYADTSGRSTGTHLHFEVRVSNGRKLFNCHTDEKHFVPSCNPSHFMEIPAEAKKWTSNYSCE